MVELFRIEEAFSSRGGFVLTPDFAATDSWQSSREEVLLEYPGGSSRKASCKFELVHFNIADPEAAIGRRWRVVPTLLNQSEKPPRGTVVCGSADLARKLGVA